MELLLNEEKIKEYKKSKYYFLPVVIIALAIVTVVFKPQLNSKNPAKLIQYLQEWEQENDTVTLGDNLPFVWDTLYSFAPYTDVDKIYETVGYKFKIISSTVDESMVQLVFMNQGKVVCYLYGYPDAVGLGMSIDYSKVVDGVRIITSKEGITFNLDKNEDIIYLIEKI